MTLQTRKEIITEGESSKYIIKKEGDQLQYDEFTALLKGDEKFRSYFINLLSGIPFRAYQWETPPVTSSTKDRPFEFVVYNRPDIDVPPDPGPFRQYFKNADEDEQVTVFNNLGNDARLIAPVPHQEELNYSHIGIFTREASFEQQHFLWKTVGETMEEQISEDPLWLNTAGGGVAWLHVRLDSSPKYYRHQPYTNI